MNRIIERNNDTCVVTECNTPSLEHPMRGGYLAYSRPRAGGAGSRDPFLRMMCRYGNVLTLALDPAGRSDVLAVIDARGGTIGAEHARGPALVHDDGDGLYFTVRGTDGDKCYVENASLPTLRTLVLDRIDDLGADFTVTDERSMPGVRELAYA